MTEHHFEIRSDEVGSRVDECLGCRLPLLSKTKLRALVAAGAATRAGKRLSIGERVQPEDVLVFRWEPERVAPGYPEKIPLEILFEDSQLVAVNKPAGMLVHPTRGVKRGTLANALLAHLNPLLGATTLVREGGEQVCWPRFIHRLDRGTSGVILAAKEQLVASLLGKALAAGQMRKRYIAILCGTLSADQVTVSESIARFDDHPPHWRAHPGGQSAQSLVQVIGVSDGLSLCRLQPLSGRTNQLRIHAASLGAPILGDALYGGATAPRLMLHAEELCFVHPQTACEAVLRAPIPGALQAAWPQSIPELDNGGSV